MSDEKKLKQAENVYNTICAMLDEQEWRYKRDDEELSVYCSARGNDLPMELRISVDTDMMLVSLLSPMPFTVPEDKRAAVGVAVNAANYALADGGFDFNLKSGSIFFRLTTSYRGSLLGKELFEYMLYVSCHTIDVYNDKLFMVSKSNMTDDEILDFIDG